MAKKTVKITTDQKLNEILKRLKRLEKEELQELKEEQEQLKGLEQLKELEQKVVAATEQHPLKKITYKDIARGSLGAFIGVVAHYTFIYGIKVAQEMDIVRATLLYPIAFVVGAIFLYATGYRKIKVKKILWFLPVRLLILYMISILMAIIVLILFLPDFMHNFWDAYKQVAAVTLTALIGACTADLIGGTSEE